MALPNRRIQENPTLADESRTIDGADVLPMVSDPAGTPLDVKVTVDELAAEIGGAAAIAAHLADTSDAHDASAISFAPNGSIAATTVQAAIQEVRDEAGGGGTAATTTFTPAGSIAATDVQAAIEETASEGLAYADFVVGEHEVDIDPHGDRAYADTLIAAADAMVFKNVIDCSANPNYPAADKGWTYRVSVAGKIGGASGINVEVGDLLLCLADGTVSGNQATVGTSWSIAQTNIDGAVIGPASSSSGNVPTFSSGTGKVLQDSGTALSALLTSASAAGTYQTITLAATKAATTDLIDAKGDRLIGSADNTLVRKAAPANGKFSVADSAQSNGWKDIDLPWHVSIDPVRVPAFSTVGGTIAAWATYYQFSALNDEVVYNVQLGPGTWTFGLWRTSFSSYGILTVTLDGTTIATLDNYSGGSVNPGQSLTTGISITAPGVYALKLKTTGKNASSSAYNQRLWAIDFTRTA